jgi:adenosylhomocysteine nucleosidase
MYKKIGVVVADDGEFNPFIEKLENADNVGFFGRDCYKFAVNDVVVYAVHCGIGKVNSAAAAMYMYSLGCDTIFSFGYSGGLSRVKKGEVVINDSFIEHDFDLTCLGYKLCEKPGQTYIYNADAKLVELVSSICPEAKIGLAVSGDCFVSNDELRDSLKTNFNAISCDMETAAIASVCDMAEIPYLSLRRVSDDAGDDAYANYNEMNTLEGQTLSEVFIKVLNTLCNEVEL